MLKLPALRPQAGFSLLELAIVLMIIGTLMGGVLDAVTLSTQFGSPVGPLLSVTSEEDCSGTVSSDVVVAVIFSRGANGITSSSSRELENSDGDECFVNTAYAEDVFDDQLVWISPYVLFNRMISAGRLP